MADKTFFPMGDRLVVRRLDHQESEDQLIEIPDVAKKESNQAEVVYKGPDVNNDMTVKIYVGDIVIHSGYVGDEVIVDGESLWVIRREDVHGVFKRN